MRLPVGKYPPELYVLKDMEDLPDKISFSKDSIQYKFKIFGSSVIGWNTTKVVSSRRHTDKSMLPKPLTLI